MFRCFQSLGIYGLGITGMGLDLGFWGLGLVLVTLG